MRFEGTKAYVATDDLKVAVNAAITLERPLLVKGEPGTGKTVLALEIAKALSASLIEWHIKSTTKALQGLYEYDAVSRLRDSQLGDKRVADIRNYIKRGKLWDAFVADERPVLLIDEIDKADIEFPNDLLQELDRMEFFVYETGETVHARRRPIVVITSNNEKELPDAFLRRCFFHYIRFPDPDTMAAIVDVHFPGIKQRLVAEALKLFYEIREVPGMKKKPSTSELLDWLKLLMVEDIGPETLRERDPKKLIPPLHGALIKNEQDVHLFERLAFMARREGRLAHHLPHQRHDLPPVKLDAAHRLLVRQRPRAVLHGEAGKIEHLDGAGDLARHRLGRADIERAVLDLALEVGAAHRRPAALGADLVAHALVVGEQLVARLRVGFGDVAVRMHADRQLRLVPSP